MRNICHLYRLLLFGTLFLSCIYQIKAEEQKPSTLKVYVHPADIPDSGVANIFSDRISRLDFLFY